jgi:CheY-like chemotaxis protein
MNILIVEDNQVNNYLLNKIVKHMGHSTTQVYDGSECFPLVENTSFDAILMDVCMPGMNGTIAMKKIKQLGIDTPVIAVTALAMAGDKEDLISDGYDFYVEKPIKPASLSEILDQILIKA